ncbi:MAG: hypothetical protein U5S82_16505 [Gammaproteobacteria bacterium]|nr:hypothetical protein [Gammaproteobacteria bacterium]
MNAQESSTQTPRRGISTFSLILIVGSILLLLWAATPFIISALFDDWATAANVTTTFFAFQSFVSSLALLGAIVSIFMQHRDTENQKDEAAQKERRYATFQLYRDFHTEEMTAARTRAHKWIESQTTNGGSLDFFSGLSPEDPDRMAILRVCQFFYSLHALYQHRLLDPQLSAAIFGFYLEWWKVRLKRAQDDFRPESSTYRDVIDTVLSFSLTQQVMDNEK